MRSFCLRIALAGLLASTFTACSSHGSSSTEQSENAVEPSTVTAQVKPSTSIAETVKRLREIKTGSDDPGVPPEAQRLLPMLKHQLRDLIHNTLNSQAIRQAAPRRLQAAILASLKRDGIEVKEPEDEVVDENYVEPEYVSGYGNIYQVVVRRHPKHRDLLVATTTLSIPCGEDTSLYVFRDRGGHWDLTLAQESNGYDEVTEAQAAFGYAVSPPDGQGDFFVVTASINPWCTSNWRRIRYAVLREGQSAYEPRILLNQDHTIFLGHETPFSIQVSANSFTLSFDGGEAMERMNNGEEVSEEEAQRSNVVKYLIEGERAKPAS